MSLTQFNVDRHWSIIADEIKPLSSELDVIGNLNVQGSITGNGSQLTGIIAAVNIETLITDLNSTFITYDNLDLSFISLFTRLNNIDLSFVDSFIRLDNIDLSFVDSFTRLDKIDLSFVDSFTRLDKIDLSFVDSFRRIDNIDLSLSQSITSIYIDLSTAIIPLYTDISYIFTILSDISLSSASKNELLLASISTNKDAQDAIITSISNSLSSQTSLTNTISSNLTSLSDITYTISGNIASQNGTITEISTGLSTQAAITHTISGNLVSLGTITQTISGNIANQTNAISDISTANVILNGLTTDLSNISTATLGNVTRLANVTGYATRQKVIDSLNHLDTSENVFSNQGIRSAIWANHFDGGYFYIGLNDQTLWSSQNGINWSKFRDASSNNNITTLAWSDEFNTLLSVISNEKIINYNNTVEYAVYYPTNAILTSTWSPELSLYLFTGTSGYYITSTTPLNHTDFSGWNNNSIVPLFMPNMGYIQSAVWSPELNMFLVGDSIGRTSHSNDGITWTNISGPPNLSSITSLTWSKEFLCFLATGKRNNNNTYTANYSYDGIVWNETSLSDDNYLGVCIWSKELGAFIIGTFLGNLYISFDAVNWSMINLSYPFAIQNILWSAPLGMLLVCYSNGTIKRTAPNYLHPYSSNNRIFISDILKTDKIISQNDYVTIGNNYTPHTLLKIGGPTLLNNNDYVYITHANNNNPTSHGFIKFYKDPLVTEIEIKAQGITLIGGDVVISMTTLIDMNAPTIDLFCSTSTNINSPTINLTGAVAITGNLTVTGNITAYYSDERLKEKLGFIENPIEKIKSIETFYYKENDLAKSFGFKNDKKQIGLSAQSVKNVLPECVSLAPFDIQKAEDGSISSKSGQEYLTVDYSKIVPLLIETIKEQQKLIDNLYQKLNISY